MKIYGLLITMFSLSCLCSCTTYALRKNAVNQTKTVSDILADEVLYNLALYKEYYDGKRVNGLPAFVKLSSGQSAVQETINAQFALKIPASGGIEKDPQLNGGHQTTDNWVFVPVVDPSELKRLFMLYKAEFTNLTPAEIKVALPKPPQALDQEGRPFLSYTPVMENGHVKMIDNKPVFDAIPKSNADRQISEIPGAFQAGKVVDSWFSFVAPTNEAKWFAVGPYLGKYIWIKDRESLFTFTMLTLGGTSGETTSKAPAALLLLNGNNLYMQPQ